MKKLLTTALSLLLALGLAVPALAAGTGKTSGGYVPEMGGKIVAPEVLPPSYYDNIRGSAVPEEGEDYAALIAARKAELDRNFTVLNAVLAMGSDLDLTQTYSGESALDVSVTLPDGTGGGKTYRGSVTATALQNNLLAYGAVKYDWGELMELLVYLTGAAQGDTQAVLDALDEGIETIIDMQTGRIYMRGQMMAAAFGAGDVDGKTWFSMDFGTMYGGLELAELSGQKRITVGGLAEAMAKSMNAGDPENAYAALSAVGAALEFLNDSHFTQDGSVWRYTGALPSFGLGLTGGGTLTMDVTMADGRATGVTGSVSYACAAQYPAVEAELICEFAFSPLKTVLTGAVDVKTIAHVEFSLTGDSAPAPDAVLPEVPAAVSLEELLATSMGIIGGADGPSAVYLTPGV